MPCRAWPFVCGSAFPSRPASPFSRLSTTCRRWPLERRPTGDILPFAEALLSAAPMQTASEGVGGGDDVIARVAGIKAAVAKLTQALLPEAPSLAFPGAITSGRKVQAPVRGSGHLIAATASTFPGLDPGVVWAALAAGVSEEALGDASFGVDRSACQGPSRCAAQSSPATATPLDESEEEEGDWPQAPGGGGSRELRFCDNYQRRQSVSANRSSALDRALDGSGSHESGLPSTRRNAAARKALRDSLLLSPSDVSNVIENMMAEDLSASTPGIGAPQLTTAVWVRSSRIKRGRWDGSKAHHCRACEAACKASLPPSSFHGSYDRLVL